MLSSLFVVGCLFVIFGNAQAAQTANTTFRMEDCNSCGAFEPKFAKNFIGTKQAMVTLSGTSSISSRANEMDMKFSSRWNVKSRSTPECPGFEDADSLAQSALIKRLTDPCRYDRLEHPLLSSDGDGNLRPLNVFARTYIYVMQSIDSNALQLKTQGLLQLRYVDPRLAFKNYAPNRQQPLLGEADLRQSIWVPHVFFTNEQDSSILGTNEKEILTSIEADGTVVISSRIRATLYCWMKLQKFPFDEQYCSTQLESWMYNASELELHWDPNVASGFSPDLHFTEYSLINAWYNETTASADESDMRHGTSDGNYSSLVFTVHLSRRSGYYILDYFIPSMIIVAISWVSFWIQPDQTSPRTTLSTSTMLSFITLSLSQDKNLPKVSYVKISEIWFLSCILFIFGSLIEFTFVNSIWRRKRNVQLKKVNSKHILKSTLVPREAHSGNMPRVASSSNSLDLVSENFGVNEVNEIDPTHTWATMTPQEVSLWIDKKARFLFPLAFLIFNIIFWTLVYCL